MPPNRVGSGIPFGIAALRLPKAQGLPVAILPPLVAAKRALYDAMRAQRITRTALARRLLDLERRSHIDQIARAFGVLGKRLEVRVLEPALFETCPRTVRLCRRAGSSANADRARNGAPASGKRPNRLPRSGIHAA